MPRVPTYGGLRVNPSPFPNVRRTGPAGVAATPESLGAGVGTALAGFGAAAAGVGLRIYEEEQQAHAQTQYLTASRQLLEVDEQLVTNPETGALRFKGLDAVEGSKRAIDAFDQRAFEIEGAATNPGAKDAVKRAIAARRESMLNRLDAHVLQQVTDYQGREAEANLDTSVSFGVNNFDDLARVGEAHSRIVAGVKDTAALLGLGPEAEHALLTDKLTRLHAGIVNELLAHDQDGHAKAYLAETRDQVDGRVLPELDRAVEAGTLRGDAQRATDDILASSDTLEDALRRVRAIGDPPLRDEVQQRVEHEFQVRAAAARQAGEATLRSAYDIVDHTKSVATIPVPVWASLDGSDRSALRNYAASLVGGVGIKTDPTVLYDLITMSTSPDPTVRRAFQETNLLRYKDRLATGDLEQMMRAQGASRANDVATSDQLLRDAAAQNGMVDQALERMGLPTKPKAAGEKGFDPFVTNRVNDFRRAVREATQRLALQQGKAATDPQVQSVVDQLSAPTGSRLRSGGGWFGSAAATPSYAFETAQAQVPNISAIPSSEVRRIRTALEAQGLRSDDTAVLNVFNSLLRQTRKDR